jgi:hypothetical protein
MFLESSPGFQQSMSSDKLFARLAVALGIFTLTLVSAGCSSISHAAPSPSNQSSGANVRVSITPATSTVISAGKQQFTATLTSTSNTAVNWSVTAGTISKDGLFVAPTATSPTKVVITATSAAQLSSVAFSEVTIVPLSKLAIEMSALPAGTVDVPYNASLAASGGSAPYQWTINSGALPKGLSLDKNTGSISGTASVAGSFDVGISVTDSNSQAANASSNLTINPAQIAGTFDGPAELPRVYVQSTMADTPAPGGVISVSKGGDFQQALNSAKCGDTIELQAGAIFVGNFTIPALACDDAHWIIVRTSTADGSLPPEGTRISPCYAGISSLPGRPPFNCPSKNNVMAQLQYSGNSCGPITFADGANHYRFIGLEITRTPSTGAVYDLVFNNRGATDHIIFDRSWFHGTAKDETQRGISLAGSQYAAVVDSYFSDFHCISRSGVCTDAQAISGGIGSLTSGPYKIVGNFLEAAGENIIFGGDGATITPSDIEIRRNHLFKPMTWLKGQPGYVGGADGNPFIVKNLFELKNAQRVLFEANILEDSWGGFSQDGFGILVTPKNQAIGSGNVCPICQVTDVTIRYVTISHVGGGMQIANGLSDNGGAPLDGERYSIHDVTIDDIDATKYDGFGDFAQVSMGKGTPVLQHVWINHVTAFQPGVLLNLGDDTTINPKMNDFVFTNNIVNAGSSPTKTTGGGPANCAYYSAPTTSLPACFKTYSFAHNAIIATPPKFPPSSYPSGNSFPASAAAVGFVNYNGGDYQLQANSPYKNAGTDGRDFGADVQAIQSETAGVY